MPSQHAQPFRHFDNMLKLTISPQTNRAETDPRQGTPTRAHTYNRLVLDIGRVRPSPTTAAAPEGPASGFVQLQQAIAGQSQAGPPDRNKHGRSGDRECTS